MHGYLRSSPNCKLINAQHFYTKWAYNQNLKKKKKKEFDKKNKMPYFSPKKGIILAKTEWLATLLYTDAVARPLQVPLKTTPFQIWSSWLQVSWNSKKSHSYCLQSSSSRYIHSLMHMKAISQSILHLDSWNPTRLWNGTLWLPKE